MAREEGDCGRVRQSLVTVPNVGHLSDCCPRCHAGRSAQLYDVVYNQKDARVCCALKRVGNG